MLAEDNHPGGSRHRKSRCEGPTMGMKPGEGWAPSHADPKSFENQLVPPPQAGYRCDGLPTSMLGCLNAGFQSLITVFLLILS